VELRIPVEEFEKDTSVSQFPSWQYCRSLKTGATVRKCQDTVFYYITIAKTWS